MNAFTDANAQNESGSEMDDPFSNEPDEGNAGNEPAKSDSPVAEPAIEDKPDEGDGKPNWMQKRIDELTRKRYEAEEAARAKESEYQARLEAAERDKQAMRALLEAQGKADGNVDAPKTYTQADVQVEARRLADERFEQERATQAQQEFLQRCNDVYGEGIKVYGDGFKQSIEHLRMAGVASEQDASFIEDALKTESPTVVLMELGQNPDEAIRIASLSPIKRAIEMDRLARKVSAPKPPQPVSKAPPPITPISSDGTSDVVDLYNDDMDAKAWIAEFNKKNGLN